MTLQVFLGIALVTSFVVAAMASDLADRDEVHRLLTDQATHDDLTGLPNRVLFLERLQQAMHARRTGSAASACAPEPRRLQEDQRPARASDR